MKKALILIITLSIQNSFSQNWEYKDVYDEFGDKTGGKIYSTKVIGTFDNSAQSGSRAILYLSLISSKYYDWDQSIGTLRFEVYEYDNNPADFYRNSKTLDLNMKNAEGEVFLSTIMTNEYDNDNEFSMTQYLYPEKRIAKRTVRNQIDEYTYELIKPTYVEDYKILNEILYKNQIIKLNIYSNRSSYYFKFKSLGKKFPESLAKLKLETKKLKKKERKMKSPRT